MVNVVNVRRVADAIERHEIADLGFNMGGFVSTGRPDLSNHGCGTTACIAGWTVAVITGRRLSHHWLGDIEYDAIEFLSIDEDLSDHLFFPSNGEGTLDISKTPKEAVRTLRHLADTYERTGVAEVRWDFDAEPAP